MLLPSLALELATAFKAQQIPIPVVYAFKKETGESIAYSAERVVLIEPDGKKDRIEVVRGTHGNPKHPSRAVNAATIRIFAKSTVNAANGQNHALRARHIAQCIVAEVDAIVRSHANALEWGACGFVTLDDETPGAQGWSGAVYELDVSIDQGLPRVTWAGEAAEEVTIGTDVSIVNTTKVSTEPGAAGTPPVDAEIAAGG